MPSVQDVVHDGVLYARSVWRSKIWGTPLHKPTLLSELEQSELTHLASVMAAAVDRQFRLKWDSKSYHDVVRSQDGGNAVAEDRFLRQFPPLTRPELEVFPLTVWDNDASPRCELWYLPNALLPHRQRAVIDVLSVLDEVLEKRGPRAGPRGWRDSEQYFRDPEFCKDFSAGVLNLAFAWQMQGHENFDADIYPSKDLSSKGKPVTKVQETSQEFVSGMQTTAIILSAALGIAHPEQYELTRESLRKVSCDVDFADLATQWAFVFNVITVVANRSTPVHRDISSGGPSLYDLLATFGGGPNTVIEFPGMGLRLQYDSGTLALFSGNVHPHGVSVSDEERVCLALYARKSVLHKYQLPLPHAVRMKTLVSFPNRL